MSFCQKSFTTNGELTVHNQIQDHTGEKPFGCSLCQKSFSTSSNLNRHKGSHSGEQ